ncbi:hypothetical protein ElyMa_002670600 [Elysia marginata]|uniref:DUF19 domain-containing protein n=1 Tax=Elysia marginata TaxID=1093978 RepID=A0AAV4H9A8_9GAST|nr:hypothetical protein ElyMa_002670600 [Elysia marginata]
MGFWTELSVCVLLFVCFSNGAKAPASSYARAKRGCYKMKTCLKPFPMLVDLIENDNAGALATLTYRSSLEDICSKQTQLETCLKGKRCNRLDLDYTIKAVSNSLSYICGAGRSALQTGSGCFSRDDFQSGVAQCTDIMHLDTKITTLAIQMGKAREVEFCGVFQNFLKCVHRKVISVCSGYAADFVSTVYAYSIKEMSDDIGCSIEF